MSTPKFLVVDDEADTLALLDVMFRSLGCDPVTESDSRRAETIIGDQETMKQFDAVFLDVMMPHVDGIALLQKLKESEHTKHLPVVLLTAQDKFDQIMSGYSHGADYYIPKPFTKAQLIYGLDLILGHVPPRAGEKPPGKFFLPEA